MNKFIINLCSVVELGCVLALAGIALKRNNDCYKAESKLASAELINALNDIKIGVMEEELKKLRNKEEEA